MRLFIAPFIAAAAFLAYALPAATADEKSDAAKKLEGTYTVVSLSENGEADDDKKKETVAFVIADGTITVKTTKRDEPAKFTIDPSKKPAHFNIMPEDKVTLKGIYETKETDAGLELTLAFPKDEDVERPTDFKGGKGLMLVKLLRKKDK